MDRLIPHRDLPRIGRRPGPGHHSSDNRHTVDDLSLLDAITYLTRCGVPGDCSGGEHLPAGRQIQNEGATGCLGPNLLRIDHEFIDQNIRGKCVAAKQ